MPSVYIKTFGCQMNERDSEAVAAQLVAKGYTLVRGEAEADVILLNTCSVRDYAEQKAFGKMENLAADVRRNRPDVVLGFMGCMAQSRGQELIEQLLGLGILRLVGQELRAGTNQLFLLLKLRSVLGEVVGVVSAKKNILPFLNLLFEIDLNHGGMIHLTNWRLQKRFIASGDGPQIDS